MWVYQCVYSFLLTFGGVWPLAVKLVGNKPVPESHAVLPVLDSAWVQTQDIMHERPQP